MKRTGDIAIKVLSLGVGLAIGIVLIAKVCFELSYDGYYSEIERIYSIRTGYVQQGESKDYGQVSGAVAPGFKQFVPGVEEATRTTFLFSNNHYLDEDKNVITGTLVLADTGFFKIFDRPVLAGDPVRVLSKQGCVMVSESFAEKLGGAAACMGKTICNEDHPEIHYTVEGVFEDFPQNGSIHYDILLSMESYSKGSTENWLGNDRYMGYVKLQEGVDPHTLTDAIRRMQEDHQPLEQLEKNGTSLRYYLVPFNKMHTSDPEVKTIIILLSIVAFLLILISLLNYILMVISAMVKRSKEVGVRKCYGAGSRNIYVMLSREAALHLLSALILAALIIFSGRGFIQNLLGVPFETLLIPQSIFAIGAVLLTVLVISVVVPAQLYMRIPVSVALRNYTENSRKWKLGLLGVQVFINVFMVVMVIIVALQYRKAANNNPGYNYENVLFMNMYDGDQTMQARVVEALRRHPEVLMVEACYGLPFRGSSGDNVYLPGEERELFNIADQYEATEGFYDLLEIKFVEGRAPRDSSEMAVSESFVQRMQEFADWSDGAVGKVVHITGHGRQGEDMPPFTISGVYKNIRIGNLIDTDTRPSARFYGTLEDGESYMPHLLIKLSGISPATSEELTEIIGKVLDGKSVQLLSYADSMRAAYEDSRKMRNTIFIGAVFSLFIALLGLVGFIRDESLRRSKEMAIRKINGATTPDILSIFALDMLKLAVAMAVLADIAAWFIARRWLEQFAERINLSVLYFMAGAMIVLVIVISVVIISSYRISRANPVDSLKDD